MVIIMISLKRIKQNQKHDKFSRNSSQNNIKDEQKEWKVQSS